MAINKGVLELEKKALTTFVPFFFDKKKVSFFVSTSLSLSLSLSLSGTEKKKKKKNTNDFEEDCRPGDDDVNGGKRLWRRRRTFWSAQRINDTRGLSGRRAFFEVLTIEMLRTAPRVVREITTHRRRCRENDVGVSRGEMRGARARERRHGDVRRALVETDWKNFPGKTGTQSRG